MQGESGAPTATSLEDVLAGAMWVSNLTDASLSADRLHETFMEVIFSFVPTEETATAAEAEANEAARRRLRTAAELARERRRKAALQREMRELQMGPDEHGVDGGARSDEEEEEEGEEEDEEDEMDLRDEQFLAWIDATQRPSAAPPAATTQPAAEAAAAATGVMTQPPKTAAIELELGNLGLGAEAEAAAADILPERFREIELREKRPRLQAKTLPGGYTYSIPLPHEAYWILRQLRNAGQPLAHNTRICALANRTQAEITDEPVIVAITFALEKMVHDFVEPAVLMVQYQTQLHPLLCALLENSALVEAAEHTLAVPSYAYSTQTGRRQRPYLSETYVGFSARSRRPIGEGDAMWASAEDEEGFTQRKPCFIELGRLLVRILELDALCHRLEYRRQQLLIMLKDSPDARVQDQRTLLDGIVFETTAEADVWHSFVQSLLNSRTGGAYHRVRELGLEDAFEEYTITGMQYQENLIANAPINLCPSGQHMPVREWAEQVGRSLPSPRGGDAVLALFNAAIVDQFARLPVLCKQIIGLFCAEGDLIVTYRWVQRRDEVYPLASFFVEYPRHYLELLQMERQGTISLYYVLDMELVQRVLNVNQLYHKPRTVSGEEDDWSTERATAMELLVLRLKDSLVPKVKAELYQQALYHLHMSCVQRLSILCAQGPYEPTYLCLEDYNDDALAWEPAWNVVEALPYYGTTAAAAATPRVLSRVCAAYRGENGVTFFCFIDEYGTVIGTARWMDCAMYSASGRATALLQSSQLEKLFVQCAPAVIAVAASNMQAMDLMRAMGDFVRDRILPVMQVKMPIVWAPCEVARFCSATRFADLETPSAEHAVRTSIALARYVQDPLHALCMLFDTKHTALQLCTTHAEVTSREHAEQLYRRLCWEMSLWVTASGFWLEDAVRRPSAVAVLQFVAGLGPSKSRVLQDSLTAALPRSRAALTRRLTELFGDYVAQNASSFIRIAAPAFPANDAAMGGGGNEAHDADEDVWHPLDQTLIPLQWYDLAAFAAEAALGKSGATLQLAALLEFVDQPPHAKRTLIDANADQQDLIRRVQEAHCEQWGRPPGERELELVLEELVANGASFLRRPYRRVSSRELMVCLTGVAYVSTEEAASLQQQQHVRTAGQPLYEAAITAGGAAASSAVVREEDYVTGTVIGVRGGAVSGIRLTTSRGLSAFIAATDISDEAMRAELLERIRHLEDIRAARDGGDVARAEQLRGAAAEPQWVRRGAMLQGRVLRCFWPRCELQLRWCPPHDVEPMMGGGGRRGGRALLPSSQQQSRDELTQQHFVSYATLVKDTASSANSLKTVQMEQDARVFSTKISRHPLFRDVSNLRANELLRGKEIGEVLLRPARTLRNRAVCVVKVGLNCTCNWIISEVRHPDGSIFYRMKDKVVEQSRDFIEVDEFLRNYIGPMTQLVLDIRRHRRFQETLQDVPGALADQERSGYGFTYAFVETGQSSRPPYYRIVTRGGGREHRFRLHITDKAIFVRLPFRDAGDRAEDGTEDQLRMPGTMAVFKWVQCRNAEHVSETVKTHAALTT